VFRRGEIRLACVKSDYVRPCLGKINYLPYR
jgi:hypothetical protein